MFEIQGGRGQDKIEYERAIGSPMGSKVLVRLRTQMIMIMKMG